MEETIALTRRARRRATEGARARSQTAAGDAVSDAADERTVVIVRGERVARIEMIETALVGTPPAGRPAVKRSIYKPRPAPMTPVAPPSVAGAPPPTRGDGSELPSVIRQSRRRSVLSIAAFAGACVVSVVGLVLLGAALVTG